MTFQGNEPNRQCPPVLFIIFNRPDLTKRVFEQIREAQPRQLFIAADGPRPNVVADVDLCERTRQVVERVDWDCEVKTLFRDTNLGCQQGPSSAIDWFFENVGSGIILEDDCLPHPTFFSFCAELLDRYYDDERIMLISGDNFQQDQQRTPYSYYFSRYIHGWGWATWGRAWQHYDDKLKYWPVLRDTPWLMDIHGSEVACMFWRGKFDKAYAGVIDTWDYQWTYSCWVQNGLAILPEINLVSNIGFDDRATHTKTASHKVTNLPSAAMQFPLRHPPFVIRHSIADQFTFETLYRPLPRPFHPLNKRLFRRILSKLRLFAKRLISKWPLIIK
jgi:hypothetical protein